MHIFKYFQEKNLHVRIFTKFECWLFSIWYIISLIIESKVHLCRCLLDFFAIAPSGWLLIVGVCFHLLTRVVRPCGHSSYRPSIVSRPALLHSIYSCFLFIISSWSFVWVMNILFILYFVYFVVACSVVVHNVVAGCHCCPLLLLGLALNSKRRHKSCKFTIVVAAVFITQSLALLLSKIIVHHIFYLFFFVLLNCVFLSSVSCRVKRILVFCSWFGRSIADITVEKRRDFS